jgi:hypothetical protein
LGKKLKKENEGKCMKKVRKRKEKEVRGKYKGKNRSERVK